MFRDTKEAEAKSSNDHNQSAAEYTGEDHSISGQNLQNPIKSCKEHEATFTNDKINRPKSDKPFPNDKKSGSDFRGLCTNCEKRFDCVVAKTTGGVWHCNEYV